MMLDFMLRSKNKDVWINIAKTYGILIQGSNGELIPADGVTIVEIGSIVLTPATVEPITGLELTPAIIDDRFHVNLRLAEPALMKDSDEPGKKKYEKILEEWMNNGVNARKNNKKEKSKRYKDIELLSEIQTPLHVFL